MRDLTKSLFSFSWAMSLFGMRQMANLLAPARGAAELDAVTRATEEQFGELLRSTFRAGDVFQRAMVDASFNLLTLQPMSSDGWMRTGMDLVQQSLDLFNRTMSMGCPSTGATGGRTGWGPVPPPPDRGR